MRRELSLARNGEEVTVLKLHLGCGAVHIPDFTHIDVKAFDHIDHIGPVDDLSAFKTGSVDLIYASHVLEHFGRHAYRAVLAEWCRVLKPGGVLRLSVPDFEANVRVYLEQAPSPGRIMSIMGALVGGQRDDFDQHKMVFDRRLLEHALFEIGFSHVSLWDWRQTEHAHIDDYSQAYFPHMDKENGQLMSLNIEAVKGRPGAR